MQTMSTTALSWFRHSFFDSRFHETRTSAPLRILRGENLTMLGTEDIYPGGEGAGYAGGITSAAVDGVKIALAIMAKFAPMA